MSYGSHVFDSGGGLIAGVLAPTLHYVGKFTYVSSSTDSYSKIQTYRINSPGGAPLPVIRVTPGNGLWYGIKAMAISSGSNWDIALTTSAAAGAVEIHAFAPLVAGAGPLEAYGMRIFGPNGEVHFDSTRKPLTVDGIVTLPEVPFRSGASGIFPSGGTEPSGIGAFGTYSVPYTVQAGTHGLVLKGSGMCTAWAGGVYGQGYYGALRVDASAIRRVAGGWVPDYPVGDTAQSARFHEEQVMVVDLNRYI